MSELTPVMLRVTVSVRVRISCFKLCQNEQESILR